jgi:hypothetical protein
MGVPASKISTRDYIATKIAAEIAGAVLGDSALQAENLASDKDCERIAAVAFKTADAPMEKAAEPAD